MSSKNRNVKGIDLPAPIAGQGGTPTIEIANVLPPAQPNIGAPYELAVIGSDLLRSAATPTARVTLRWRPPVGVAVTRYEVQAARNSGFTVGLVGQPALEESAQVAYLDTGTTYYFRVRAIAGALQSPWSNTVSVTTEQDTTPPNPPSALAAAFLSDGALRITWQLPTSPNFRAVELRIFNGAGKAVEYDVIPEAGGTEYRWPAARNRQQTVGSPDSSPDPAVFIEARAVSWGNAYSTIVSTSATKAPPANISGLAWDFAGPDAIFTCTPIADAVAYEWTIDGRLYETTYPTFTYTYAENQLRHSGTAVPSLPYSIRARDALDQRSAAATVGTATNAAPTATTITAQGVFSTIALTIVPSSATDLRNYRIRVYKDTVLQSGEAFFTNSLTPIYTVKTGSGSYTFDVTVFDIFNQGSTASALSTAQQAVDITQFVADLRSGAVYSNSIGTASATLFAALADDNPATTFSYTDSGLGWRWTQIERTSVDRYRTITFDAATTIELYLATSEDGVTWQWFGGPLAGGRTLVAMANEAAAQAAPVNTGATPLSGTRLDLPSVTQARFVRMYHRKVGSNYTFRTLYPRRLVQSDDMEAETVTTVNLAAFSVTADKTFIGQLSAITGDMGSLTAGTITGATIRTAATGQRVELTSANGLRGIDSGGVTQVQISPSTGKMTTGPWEYGNDGPNVALSLADVAAAYVTWAFSGSRRGRIGTFYNGSRFAIKMMAADVSGVDVSGFEAQGNGWFTVYGNTTPTPIIDYDNNRLYFMEGFVDVGYGNIRINSTQVLTSRRTGWGAPTGTATRTAFNTATVTLVQLAERMKALIDDMRTHGAIGN